ncbi:hypothetical protein Mycch_5070 [Mycolicibacterium chubuense NBB4]|uniref:Uncharacterized protein n=1 Tax=Mycolicibacterium chubuense (strain NBB4) TaxID=710421 RepID=I4BR50_MYCCN|nr:hypothetical protein [Mycolicibacterium chubuense]AFM19757.1 hypothetical protein Mycch_5070 [Mycolicibacterium chubuense NBB4]
MNVVVLADHSLLLALPAVAPAFVVAGVVVYIARKNRRKQDTESETSTND